MIIKWEWQCTACSEEVTSRSDELHTMNGCSCGICSVDLEEHYCRTQGEIKIVSIRQLVGNKWVKI